MTALEVAQQLRRSFPNSRPLSALRIPNRPALHLSGSSFSPTSLTAHTTPFSCRLLAAGARSPADGLFTPLALFGLQISPRESRLRPSIRVLMPFPSVAATCAKLLGKGIVNLGLRLKEWYHQRWPFSLLRLSFSSRDHQLCGLGSPSVPLELPRCSGSARRAANHREGIVNLGMSLKEWCHEERPFSFLRLSLASRDHQLYGVGLPSVLLELPRCRGSSRRARNYRLL